MNNSYFYQKWEVTVNCLIDIDVYRSVSLSLFKKSLKVIHFILLTCLSDQQNIDSSPQHPTYYPPYKKWRLTQNKTIETLTTTAQSSPTTRNFSLKVIKVSNKNSQYNCKMQFTKNTIMSIFQSIDKLWL